MSGGIELVQICEICLGELLERCTGLGIVRGHFYHVEVFRFGDVGQPALGCEGGQIRTLVGVVHLGLTHFHHVLIFGVGFGVFIG